jgi:uncharacterized protein (TIGR03083 family)
MDHHAHTAALEPEIRRFVEVIADADLSTPVPTCPGWDLAELVRHQGRVHRWAGWHVAHLAAERAEASTIGITFPDADNDLPAWLASGGEELVTTLRAADGDAPMYAWGADQHARFWSRRQLHETVVHRADAELALGVVPSIDPAIAVDGIDELLDNIPSAAYFAPNTERLRGTGETLHLHCTDTDGEWMITLEPDGFRVEHAHGKGDVAVRGAAGELLLLMYNRRVVDDGFQVFGDRALLERWLADAAL